MLYRSCKKLKGGRHQKFIRRRRRSEVSEMFDRFASLYRELAERTTGLQLRVWKLGMDTDRRVARSAEAIRAMRKIYSPYAEGGLDPAPLIQGECWQCSFDEKEAA